MIGRVVFVACMSVMVVLLFAPTTHAKNKGLAVAPARLEMTVQAGQSSEGSIMVGNYTDKPLTVNLFVQRFAAVDYTYDFDFSSFDGSWILFEQPRLTLNPKEEKKVKFSVNAPDNLASGGHYFALTASADMSGNGLGRIARVVSQLYLSVGGEYKQSGTIGNGSVPFLVYNDKILFTFDAKNTGNIHYTAFFYGHLDGLFYSQSDQGVNHILLPGTTRRVGGAVSAPNLPGLYTLTYGYSTDYSKDIVTKKATILYLPPWSIAALVLLLLAIKWVWQKKKSAKS